MSFNTKNCLAQILTFEVENILSGILIAFHMKIRSDSCILFGFYLAVEDKVQ